MPERHSMIPNNNENIVAHIGEDRVEPVIAFDRDGNALILDASSGVLRPANTHPDFKRLHVILWRDFN